jgi:hypothetical protein
MRSCQNLSALSFCCVNWGDCITSDSWKDLPVPPVEVIQRGTQGVFEFLDDERQSCAARCLRMHAEKQFVLSRIDRERIDGSGFKLSKNNLLLLLETFREGKFSMLQKLNLVSWYIINNG